MNSSTCEVLHSTLSSTIIANIVFNGCLCFSTTMLNTLKIHALRKASTLSNALKTLLLSLTVSDLGIGLLGQPMYIALLAKMLRCNSKHLPILDGLAGLVLNTLFLSSFFSIIALSVDRFLALQKPLRYEEIVAKKRVNILIIAIMAIQCISRSIRCSARNSTKHRFSTFSPHRITLLCCNDMVLQNIFNRPTSQHANSSSSTTDFPK